MDKKSEEKYENYFKERYGYNFSQKDLYDFQKWFYSQWILIKNQIDFSKINNILEIGSSIGGFYSFLQSFHTTKFTGIELDKDAKDFATKLFANTNFIHSSFEKFDDNKKFDAIFAFEVIEHVDNPELVIKKIYSQLEKEGLFCGTSPFPFEKNIVCDKTHKYVLHPKTWERLFVEAGFAEVRVIPMSFFPFLWRINKKLNIRLPFYISWKFFISTTLIIAKNFQTY